MKPTLPGLALLAALLPALADDAPRRQPAPPSAAAANGDAPGRDRKPFPAQDRPNDGDRNSPRAPFERPTGGQNPPPPPGRGDVFGGDRGKDRSSNAPGSSQNSGRMMRMDSRGRAVRPVVVTSQPLDSKELALVEEDLGIMARLLEKEIERETGSTGTPNALGIPLFTRQDGRSPAVQLLEGYGAVFTFQVRLPLLPTTTRATEKQPERPTDSPWERTRRELFGPPGGGGREGDFGPRGGDGWPGRAEAAPYDAKKIEALKQTLLESLKHAANIRHLKPDDYVTIVVQGSGGGTGPMEFMMETRTMTSTSVNGGPPRVESSVNREGGENQPAGLLTVRVKKSAATEFATGKLTPDQFRKQALVNLR